MSLDTTAVISLLATMVGALGGALFAAERRFGLSGVLALAFAAGCSGSIMRDVLLQGAGPSVVLTDVRVLLTVALCAVAVFFFASAIRRLHRLLLVLDALSIGFFAAVGTAKAIGAGLDLPGAVLVGSINAVGGWVLRDLLAGERPQLVLPGPIYAIAAGLASAFYAALAIGGLASDSLAAWATIIVGFAIRMLALRYGWTAPTPVDLTPGIRRGGRD
jgi:uncharacterized membrane protein YeiH